MLSPARSWVDLRFDSLRFFHAVEHEMHDNYRVALAEWSVLRNEGSGGCRVTGGWADFEDSLKRVSCAALH